MDQQWGMRPRPLSPPRLAREHASFSAALLDAIYRSVDTSPGKHPDSKNSSPDISRVPPAEFWREPRAALPDHKSQTAPQKYPSTPRYLISSTTSTPRHRPDRTNRVRPDPSLPSAPSPPPNEEAEFQLRSKNDKKKGKKKRSIMRLLKSLFSLKRDKKANSQLAQPQQLAEASTEIIEPIGSSARPCMSSRKKSEGPKRSVRFAPVSVMVDEECKPCGHKRAYDGAVEKRVEELIKALKVEDRGRRKGSKGSNGSGGSEFDSLVAVACQDLH
ncbi:hypothetical protein FCM35_KLT08212 [Carex littledalei]|uniref:Uncharacterized protein n=1 Tax=Carex littledalei TaxID=544730 RepID=A0A833QVS1_9POAL|nr:hypothetical protein FCM35_KLT08212 [Carex littledalei]